MLGRLSGVLGTYKFVICLLTMVFVLLYTMQKSLIFTYIITLCLWLLGFVACLCLFHYEIIFFNA